MPSTGVREMRWRAGNSLPGALTPLLGRERELEETGRLLASGRLLTITGTGGSGKTRIALELAHRACDGFSDGALWIDLAPLSQSELVAQQLLDAVGMPEAAAADATPLVVDALRDRNALVVLDNCEHLVDACAMLAEALLRNCHGLSIVATSREALGIAGEQTWLVPPLSDPDATALFVDRARAVAPAFMPDEATVSDIAQICHRLDGIPLAIELAAARVKVLSVGQIAERLVDAFSILSAGQRTVPRHRTIRETIDWSFRLLQTGEQMLLRRLAVFAGSFSLAAAVAVCDEDEHEVLSRLSALVDKSLVLREAAAGDARYRLLETVRQFAAEKLQQSRGRNALRERHARFFVGLAEAAAPKVFAGAGDPPTLARLDEEIGNLRAVFDWAAEDDGGSEYEQRLVYALHWYWFARGHFNEARARAGHALARPSAAGRRIRARALVAAANAAVWQGDWRAMRPLAEEAVELLREGNDLQPLAVAMTLYGVALAFEKGDMNGSEMALDIATQMAERIGGVGVALTLYWSGVVAQMRGDTAAARRDFHRAYTVGLELGNQPAIGHSLTGLGHVALHEGRLEEAVHSFREALEVHAAIDDRWGLTQVIEGIGLALLDSGDAELGTRLLAGASAAWLQLGARPGRHEDFEQAKNDRIRQAVGDQRLRVMLASGAAMRYGDMVALAREQAARLDSRNSGTPAAPAGDGPRLSVRALGSLEILRDDALVDPAAQSARARELLLFLLCNPRGCTKEQIGAAMWPEVDPAKLRNNFHVTIHRLRKMLGGADWVSVEGETYALARDARIEFDAERFEREIRTTIPMVEKQGGDPERLARAVELYRGDFFENASTGEWHLEIRDRLRELLSQALVVLGRSRMTAGDFAGAATVYQRLASLDDLDEQAARNLMTSLGRVGDTEGAARAYRRLAEALRRELGVEPDPATTRVYERVVRKA
jgi:predicted ATPase/DNA-binding SARP family transcriptional activator